MNDQDLLARLVRIETRLTKLMRHLGLNPYSDEPRLNQEKRFEQRQSDNPRPPAPPAA